jgi:hypothetical protein
MAKNNLDDLFEVPKSDDNDITVEHLIKAPKGEDLSDLTSVSNEDIMGDNPEEAESEEVELNEMPGTPANTGATYRIQPLGSQTLRRVRLPNAQNTVLRGQNQ